MILLTRRRRMKDLGWITLLGCIVIFVEVSSATADKCPPPENIMPCRCRGRNEQIQVWCSHSDLERVNGALENLMRLRNMPAIDELIVENNKMPTLPARAFGALQIGRLLLRNNGLESLSRNAFAGLEDSLEELYIVEDKLVDFPFDAIEKLRNLEAFTIEKSRIRLLPRFSGLNRLKHIRIDGSLITGFPVGAFSSMSSVKQIHVVNSHVERLAEGIFGRLDSLILANFSGNRIDHIQRRCFALLPRLEVLSLGSNRLGEAVAVGRSMEELIGLKSLDLSKNQFKELPEGSFVNLRSLQLLNLAGNQISQVQQRSFTHLPALRKVDLSENLLKNFPRMLFDTTPLLEELRMRKNQLGTASELGEMLSSLKSLRYLDLGDNGITELPTGAVKDHSQLQTLDLSDNRIVRIQRHAFQNVPSLQEMSLKNNSIKDLPSDGDAWDISSLKELDISSNNLGELSQTSLRGLPKLSRIDLSHNSIKSLPKAAFGNNKEMEFLDMSENGMTMISPEALQGLTKLSKLDLSRNHLESIQSGSFKDLRSLQSLNMGNNRINNVAPNLLNDLKSLEDLNFKSNSLSFIPQGFFQTLSSLKDLNLKHNSIQEINGRMFTGLDNLEQLRLSSNQISRFDESAFDDLLKLRGIDLSSNRINKLPSRSFKNLPTLERFEARENRIHLVEPGILANSEALQILDLAHNALTSVPDILKSNPALKVIDLSHNQIATVEQGTFKKLTGLMELYLNDNKIKGIKSGTFEDLGSLTIVDMDGNDLEEVPEGMFKNLPRLIYLRMSRNRIKNIGRGGFSNLNSLDGLDLQENELEEISPGGFDKTGALKYLNLSHNNLDKMGRMGLLPLGSLEVLDLSFNKLSSVDSESLRHLIWLVEFRMNDNGLCMIPTGTFDGMSRLKMLVLRNNRLKHLYESVFYKLRNNIAFLDVSGNPLECDCEMTWLRNLMAREELQELSDSVCEGPGDLKGTAVKQARPGRMICTNTGGGKRGYTQSDEDCPPLAQSKRKPRPSSVEPDERPLFGNTVQDEFYGDPGQNELKNNRRKDDKHYESNDYISGDTPTIYAGSSIASATKATQQDVKKSAGGGNGVLSSLFGIPLDFGFNFGISPAFSWSDKEKKKGSSPGHNSKTGYGGDSGRKGADPLPPSWIERPSKGNHRDGNVYEAPEYLPRKPAQPYIPLNPLSEGSHSVVPSGSVDVHKRLAPQDNPRKSTGIKFPEGPSSPPRSSWHPNYPNTETGFIPIEPFFHNKPNKSKSHQSQQSVEKQQQYSTPSPSHNFNQIHSDSKGTTIPSSTEDTFFARPPQEDNNKPSPPTTGSSSVSESEEYEDDPSYTPVSIQTTATESAKGDEPRSGSNNNNIKDEDFSLSDFWGMFNGKNQTEKPITDEDRDGQRAPPDSYEDSMEDNSREPPFNFSAPVDTPMEPEYNIPFGEPSGGRLHVTGKPTITKIIETSIPSYNDPPETSPNKGNFIQESPDDHPRGGSRDEENIQQIVDNPSPSPLVPPVIIGNRDAEPLDWYYTNYHKSGGSGGEELLERLLDRSRVNDLNDDVIILNSAHSVTTLSPYRYLLLSLLYYFVVVN